MTIRPSGPEVIEIGIQRGPTSLTHHGSHTLDKFVSILCHTEGRKLLGEIKEGRTVTRSFGSISTKKYKNSSQILTIDVLPIGLYSMNL